MALDTVKQISRALRHRNYRLFFSGQGISLIGTWMQQIALGWLVYRLTDSAFLLGESGRGCGFPCAAVEFLPSGRGYSRCS